MEGVIPESVLESVQITLTNFDEFETQFLEFLPLIDPEVLVGLDPLERAQALMLLARATTAVFSLRLRCNGVDPDDHAAKSENDRVSLYKEKVDRCIDTSKAPLRPSATLNRQAATRFIEHSLPDLTPGQRQSMREISSGTKIKSSEKIVCKKRKCDSTGKQSVQTAAQEFLEKAAKELLCDTKNGGFKGPLRLQDLDSDSDDDDNMPIG